MKTIDLVKVTSSRAFSTHSISNRYIFYTPFQMLGRGLRLHLRLVKTPSHGLLAHAKQFLGGADDVPHMRYVAIGQTGVGAKFLLYEL
jgi:hypothetical protein